MAKRPKKDPKFQCPLTPEQKDLIKEAGDVVDKHRRIVKKFTGC